MRRPLSNPPLTPGELTRGALLAAWLVACDLGALALARVAACPETRGLGAALGQPWGAMNACRAVPVAGPWLALWPQERPGLPFGALADTPGAGPLVGLGLLALATVVTILVLRWRWRSAGDALALGALWGGAGARALVRLAGPGPALTSMWVAGVGFGPADLALLWAAAWLPWRLVAELRA